MASRKNNHDHKQKDKRIIYIVQISQEKNIEYLEI